MTPAYSEVYVSCAQACLGSALDYAAESLHLELGDFFGRFLASGLSGEFALGSSHLLAGTSGVELACQIMGTDPSRRDTPVRIDRSREYWTGWALAYYQWISAMGFGQIDELVPVEEIRELYDPYHEMDILQFVDKMDELCRNRQRASRLKRARLRVGLTQRQLAELSDVPLRTIQQYEQGQKDINKAQAATVLSLARALCCEPGSLLEHVPSTGRRDYAFVRM